MRPLQLSQAQKAWLGLLAYIVITDAYLMRSKQDTMSICYGKWLEQERSRKVCIALTALVVAHLHWSVPLPGQTVLRRIATKSIKQRNLNK